MKNTIRGISMENDHNNDGDRVFCEMPAANPVIFDESKCNGCNNCVNICQVDIFVPNPVKGKPPVVLFPGECWYCGCCVVECPQEGAIELVHPLMNRPRWIAKDSLK
jgi:NAD-dependent dihydropyrimidine dehydrogenase PreA subunit